jgi:transposase
MPLPTARRASPRRPWAPLTDAQWAALSPYVIPATPQGRSADHRQRMDAIFYIANTPDPWRALPERFGRPDTVARHFRRLTQAGLWQRLLIACARAGRRNPLRAIEPFVTRACRRAIRLLGLGFIATIRKIGLITALNGPPAWVADPLLSESIDFAGLVRAFPRATAGWDRYLAILRALKGLHRACAGRAHLPRWLRLAWS